MSSSREAMAFPRWLEHRCREPKLGAHRFKQSEVEIYHGQAALPVKHLTGGIAGDLPGGGLDGDPEMLFRADCQAARIKIFFFTEFRI
jgi:hypothetical protein